MNRKERRALRVMIDNYLLHDRDGRPMLVLAAEWLGSQFGFENSSMSLRKLVVRDLCAREISTFEPFEDDTGIPGVRLVNFHSGEPLPFAVLFAAKLREQIKGKTNGRR